MTIDNWKQNFKDFYYESGEYRGRELGINSYISFIEKTLESQRSKILAMCEEMHKNIGFNVAMGNIRDENAAGYNQALSDIIEKVKEL